MYYVYVVVFVVCTEEKQAESHGGATFICKKVRPEKTGKNRVILEESWCDMGRGCWPIRASSRIFANILRHTRLPDSALLAVGTVAQSIILGLGCLSSRTLALVGLSFQASLSGAGLF